MTTRDLLIYRLQGLYSFYRDYLPLLDEERHEGGNQRLSEQFSNYRDDIRAEMDTLERALSLLGAQHKMERNAMAVSMKDMSQRFKHQMNPSQEQLDMYALLTAQGTIQVAIGAYQGSIELARAVGEQDVAMLLEENLQRQSRQATTLREFAPTLIQEISAAESRQAA